MNTTEQIGYDIINYIIKGNLVHAEQNACIWSMNAAEQIGEFVREKSKPRMIIMPMGNVETLERMRSIPITGNVLVFEQQHKNPGFWRRLWQKIYP